MDAAEFDRFADEYQALQARSVRLSGETPDYFARYKIVELRRLWDRLARPEPARILDFGTGVGSSIPHLAALFPQSRLTGVDVSSKSLDIAAKRFGGLAEFRLGDLDEAKAFDIVFSACVFHHIDAGEHVGIFAELRRRLAPGGLLVIFEHNPFHPGVRHIVASCPFDESAVLIPAAALRRRQVEAGFEAVGVAYTTFFPGPLRFLRWLEPRLKGCPLGAQYYTFAHG